MRTKVAAVLSEKNLAHYRDEGYCTIERALSSEQLAGLRVVCDSAVERVQQRLASDSSNKEISTLGQLYFANTPSEHELTMREFWLGEPARSLCAAILGDAFFFYEQFVVKSGERGRPFAWHQDSGYIDYPHSPYLTCWFALDVRTTPEYDTPELVQIIGRVLGPEVQLAVKGAGARAQATPREHPVIRAAVAATGAQAVGSPTVSDWARLDGVPAVKLGPGESPRSHTPDEYVTVGELERGADVYVKLVEAWLAHPSVSG